MRNLALAILMTLSATLPAAAMDAQTLAQKIAARPANDGRVATMVFKMINKDGRERKRTALMAHAQGSDTERVAIYFTAPAAIEETAFLSYDHTGQPDENWLYLPATEKVRRLPPSDRGDYFLGTDLTYGDIKDNFKFKLEDWTFTGGDDLGSGAFRLNGAAISHEVAKEMGYAGFTAKVDGKTWFPVEITFSDVEGAPLKTVRIPKIEQVGGAWTAMTFSVEQHQSGHQTFVHFEEMRHVPGLDEAVFDPNALSYGVPDIGS